MTTTTAIAAGYCHRKGVGRWTQPTDPMDVTSEWTPDPGPYTVGETVTCDCGATTTVIKSVTNDRSAGKQYVGLTDPHPTAASTHAASRERLRATVADILTAVQDGTSTADDAETAIMDAAQRWAVEGYIIGATPTPAA